MKADEEGQRGRFLAPRRENVEGEHYEVQPPGMDRARSGGPNGVSEDPRAVDPTTGLVVKGVVESEGDRSPRREAGDQEEGERTPEMVGRPSPLAEESGVGVVGPSGWGGGEAPETREGAPTRRKDPYGDEFLEDKEGGGGEGAAFKVWDLSDAFSRGTRPARKLHFRPPKSVAAPGIVINSWRGGAAGIRSRRPRCQGSSR